MNHEEHEGHEAALPGYPLGKLCTSRFELPFLDGVGIGIGIGIDAFRAVFLGTSRPDTGTDTDSDPD